MFGRERGMHQLIGKWWQVLWNVGEREGNALPRRCANTLKNAHLCRFDVLVHKLMGKCRQVLWNALGERGECTAQKVCKYISMYVCCCALLLLFATMICVGSFFVLLSISHPGFCISMYVCCCALWLLLATMICFGSFIVLLNQIWWDRGRLYCRESAQWLAQKVIQSDLMG